MNHSNRRDQDQISIVHGLPPLNHRDASTSKWKNTPTPIATPTNNARNLTGGPFDRHIRNGVKSIGNVTANQTMTSRPHKKPKIDHTFDKKDDRLNVKGKGKGKVKLGPEMLIDVDEDIGDSADDLNIVDGPSSFFKVPETKPALPLHPFDATNSHDGTRERRSSNTSKLGLIEVKDGPDTAFLIKRLDYEEPVDESNPLKSVRRPTDDGGRVKRAVAKIEANPVPHRDLRMSGSIKSGMKGKRETLHMEILTSQSLQTRGSPKSLPVAEIYMGWRHHSSQDSTCQVLWERDMLTIKWPKKKISFDVRGEITQATSTEYSPKRELEDNIVELRTLAPLPKKVPPSYDEKDFKMGDISKGVITIKFDSTHSDCSKQKYQAFTTWISTRTKHCVSRESTLWQVAEMRAWDSSSSRTKSDKTPMGRDKPKSLKRRASGDCELTFSSPPPVPISIPPRTREEPRGRSPANDAFDTTESNRAGPSGRLRRSTRQTVQPSKRSPPVDQDEVILVYPQGVTGAVNITNADVGRLVPGEFLNDTLIEFGLKLWLRELEEKNPVLANQIHVFSSFFYKKLNKKNFEEGYESIRKWTSRFNIFEKKYVIVPINENLHWYLAIIYQPEHILLPPPPPMPSPSTRRRTQQSSIVEVVESQPESSIPHGASPAPSAPMMVDDLQGTIHSDNEVADSHEVAGLLELEIDSIDFSMKASITVSPSDNSVTASESLKEETVITGTVTAQDSPLDEHLSTLSTPDVDMDAPDSISSQSISRGISPTVSDFNLGPRSGEAIRQTPSGASSPGVTDVIIDDDTPSVSEKPDVDAANPFDVDIDELNMGGSSVPAAQFYNTKSSKAMGKRKADPQPAPFPMDVVEIESDTPVDSSTLPPATYVFTLDSLGAKHPQAIKNLVRYLKMEAKDKLKRENTSTAVGKQVPVPVQPNYCDCGIYLLHFAQTFMTDPVKYCHTIVSRKGSPSMPQRQAEWRDAQIAGIRENLIERIRKLSVEWRKDREVKEEAKKKEIKEGNGETETVESSDDDIDIVETTLAKTPGKGKPKVKTPAKKTKATRIR